MDRRVERRAGASPIGTGGKFSEAIVWSDLCAERARLRHPLMNVLLDYGVADTGRTFEAYSVGEPVRASGRAASQLLQHAGRFMASQGVPLVRTSRTSRCARSSPVRSASALQGGPRETAANRRRGRPVVERADARAHPPATGHSREPERGARGRRAGRYDELRDCRRTRVGHSDHEAAGRADGAAGGIRSGRELGPRSPAVAARMPCRTAPVRAARRSLARRQRDARDVPGAAGRCQHEAARGAPIHPN